jgi:uncharacterized cupin superfamily protein
VLVSLESGERLVVSAPVDDGAARLGAGDAVGVRASNPAVHSVAERSEQVGAPVVGAPA